jgi:pimeloyl-ACP methyl ester carboxylesterase
LTQPLIGTILTVMLHRSNTADLLGFSRLAIDGTVRLTNFIEEIHYNIAPPTRGTTGDITDLVYNSIRAITGLVGGKIDAILTPLIPILREKRSTREREALLAALNGVLGDYLAGTHNPLAISMRLRRKGRPLTLERAALAASIPHPGRKLLLLVHGLCMSDCQWTRKRHNHGTALARDLGYTAVQLHYNGGLHISTNGRAFANLIEELLDQWPVPLEEFAIVAHSLGGLVARSAYHYGAAARHRWPQRLTKLIFLGTPHHGAPLERVGNWVNVILERNPYTSPLARLGKIRSAGITDLRYGSLLDEDWEGRDRFEHSGDPRRPVPLPQNVQCYAIAATTGKESAGLHNALLGDGLVPVDSALGRHGEPGRSLRFSKSQQWIGYGMNHWDLLNQPAVYEQMVRWLA